MYSILSVSDTDNAKVDTSSSIEKTTDLNNQSENGKIYVKDSGGKLLLFKYVFRYWLYNQYYIIDFEDIDLYRSGQEIFVDVSNQWRSVRKIDTQV